MVAKSTKALSPMPLEKGRPLTVVSVVVTVSTMWDSPSTLPTRLATGLARRRAHSSDGESDGLSDSLSDGARAGSPRLPITSIATLLCTIEYMTKGIGVPRFRDLDENRKKL